MLSYIERFSIFGCWGDVPLRRLMRVIFLRVQHDRYPLSS
jgi:hypothetical protein